MLPDLRGGCDRGPCRTSWLLCSPAGQPVCTPGVPFSPKEGKDVGFLGDSLSMGSAQMAALPHCPVRWLPHVLCQPQPLRRGLVPSWHSAGQVLAEPSPSWGREMGALDGRLPDPNSQVPRISQLGLGQRGAVCFGCISWLIWEASPRLLCVMLEDRPEPGFTVGL